RRPDHDRRPCGRARSHRVTRAAGCRGSGGGRTALRLVILSAALAAVACSSNQDPIVRRSVADTDFVSSPGDGLYRFSPDKPVNWTYHLVETLRIDASRLDIGR